MSDVLAIDGRSMAAFRIATGCLIACDAWWRLPDALALYSDSGAFPRALVGVPIAIRALYFVDGSAAWATFLLLLQGFMGLGFAWGFYTRTCQVMVWLLLGSLSARLGGAIQAGDVFLRQMMGWTLFLPLAAKWSLDAHLRPAPATPRQPVWFVGGSLAALGQLYLMYLVTGWAKASHPAWQSGSAVFNALSAEYLVTKFGLWLRAQPFWWSQVLTWSTLALELAGPVLLLVLPRRVWPAKMAVVIAFCAFHLGIASTLNIGLFSAVMVAAWLLAIPSGAWQALAANLSIKKDSTGPSEFLVRKVGGWQALPIVLFAYLLGLTLCGQLGWWPLEQAHMQTTAKVLGLNRHWQMFVRPRSSSGSVVVRGTDERGRQLDLAFDGASRQRLHAVASQDFANQRWRKVMVGLAKGKKKAWQRSYLRFVCERWNAMRRPGRRLTEVELIYLTRRVGRFGPYGDATPKRKQVVKCF